MIELGSHAFWRATLALCLGSFMIFANVYLTHPLLPVLVREFGVSELEAGWSVTITTLTLGASLLVYGTLSDALGRKNLMVLSMAGVVLTTFLLSMTTTFAQHIVLRGIQGFFLGGLPAIAIAYMGDEFRRQALVMAVGFYISGNSLGGIFGRLVGGFVGDWVGWQATFLVMTLLSLLLFAAFCLLLPSSAHFTPKPLQLGSLVKPLGAHLRKPVLCVAYAIGGLNFFIFLNQYSFATFMLSEAPYQLSSAWLGLLFLTYLSGTIGASVSGRVAQYWSSPVCMALGIVILMVGSVTTLLPTLWGILLGFLINAFGFFFCHAAASSWVSQNADHSRASASALYLVFYYLGASTGGFYLQPFWQGLGWQGVVLGSLIILLLTLSGALWLVAHHNAQRLLAEPSH